MPEDREDDSPLRLPSPLLGNSYLALVAICHQTQSLHGVVAGRACRGWDYLKSRWELAAGQDAELVRPARWARLSAEALARLFEDPEVGRTLSAVEARAALLNDLGRVMEAEGWESLEDLYRLADRHIASGSPHLLELLARFRAYDDPVRKKSFFLLGLMRNSVGWEYADAQELGAPVDYHEVRGHLRLGTVVVNDPGLHEKLLRHVPVDEAEDVAIRGAVARAIRSIGEAAGTPAPMRLHYLFWNLFRSVCLREGPHCRSYPASGPLPPRYAHLVVHKGAPHRCPFCDVCPSADASVRYLEHAFATDWY